MRMTIASRLGIGFGILILIPIIVGLILYRNIRATEEALTELTTVEEPTNAAAYGMEVNVMLVAGLIISSGAALTISRGIVRPVRKLVEGADKIGRGVLDHRVEITTEDEMGELAACRSEMSYPNFRHFFGLPWGAKPIFWPRNTPEWGKSQRKLLSPTGS